jgi:hypothetical protein
VDAAVKRFADTRDAALRRAYSEGRRAGAYDPARAPRDVSANRPQAYDDEAALYDAAAAAAGSPEVAALLRERARVTREVRDRERALLDPSYTPPARPAGDTTGLGEVLEREVGR